MCTELIILSNKKKQKKIIILSRVDLEHIFPSTLNVVVQLVTAPCLRKIMESRERERRKNFRFSSIIIQETP